MGWTRLIEAGSSTREFQVPGTRSIRRPLNPAPTRFTSFPGLRLFLFLCLSIRVYIPSLLRTLQPNLTRSISTACSTTTPWHVALPSFALDVRSERDTSLPCRTSSTPSRHIPLLPSEPRLLSTTCFTLASQAQLCLSQLDVVLVLLDALLPSTRRTTQQHT
ncbi:hypothetical protein VTJ04DRAFT_3003 [Mycothermus thermophilus]|uniref:uncharacterized protein n=1 Tax=Humicola insolens TaxID=85995 RepID=UPI0037448F05